MRRLATACLVLFTLIPAACTDPTSPSEQQVILSVASGGAQSGEVGMLLDQLVVIQAQNEHGQGVAGVRLRWTFGSGFPADTVLSTDREGLARLSVRLDTTAGEHTARVQQENRSATTIRVALTALAGAPASVESPGDTVRLRASEFGFAPVFRDRYGNRITDREPHWSIADTSVLAIRDDGRPIVHRAGVTDVTLTMDEVVVHTHLVLVGWASVEAAPYNVCGLTSDGRAYCWGPAAAPIFGGAVGAACEYDLLCHRQPVPVAPDIRFESLSNGGQHVCGLDRDSVAWCWGGNTDGQLGDGTTIDRIQPVQVAGGHRFAQLAASDGATCGREADGSVFCWGKRIRGQIGNGAPYDGSTLHPARVSGGPYVHIESGENTICGARTDGSVECWGMLYVGSNGSWATTQGHGVPTPWGTPYRWDSFSVADARTFCWVSEGQVYCWGHNDVGQAGNGTTEPQAVPALIAASFSARHAAAAEMYGCAIALSGEAWCWGSAAFGKLGRSVTQTCRADEELCDPMPGIVGGTEDLNLQRLSLASSTVFATDTIGRLFGWGLGYYGMLAGSSFHNNPVVEITVPM